MHSRVAATRMTRSHRPIACAVLLAAVGMGSAAITSAALYYLVVSTLGVGALFLLAELVERGRTFGTNLIALRLASTIAAFLTIGVLMWWTRRVWGAATAICAGIVLSSCFAFLHEHSGRSANTDALFTLLVLLTVVVLWAAQARAWVLAWIGPIAAAVFLLRGMGVLMPLVIVAAIALSSPVWLRRIMSSCLIRR